MLYWLVKQMVDQGNGSWNLAHHKQNHHSNQSYGDLILLRLDAVTLLHLKHNSDCCV
jgi:hypothetical protein